MNPAETTRSGSWAATASASAASQPARSGKSGIFSVKVGRSASCARVRPAIPSRSAPTATTDAP